MKRKQFLQYLHTMFAVCAAFLVVLCASCNMTDSPADEAQTTSATKPALIEGEQVAVRIVVDEAAFRTALPQGITITDFTEFSLAVDSGIDPANVWTADDDYSAYEKMTRSFAIVSPGLHTFTLTGTEKNGAEYASSIAYLAESDTVLNFVLSLQTLSTDGNGGISITVNYLIPVNKAYSVRNIVCALYPSADGSTYDAEKPVAAGAKTYTHSGSCYAGTTYAYKYEVADLAAGTYIATFTFCDFYGCVLDTKKETVYVTNGWTSKSTVPVELNHCFVIRYNIFGSGTCQNYQSFNPLEGATLVVPESSDQTFGGWYMGWSGSHPGLKEFSGEPVTEIAANTTFKDIALYAKWNYTLSFESNDTEDEPADGMMESIVDRLYMPITLKNTFTRDGYVFYKWNTKADGSGTNYEDESEITSTRNITLYAQWLPRSENTVVVSFRTGGETILEPVAVEPGKKVPEPSISKVGHHAVWYTSPDFDKNSLFNIELTPVTKDVTLYLKWAPDSYALNLYDVDDKVEYMGYSGEDLEERYYYYGDAYRLPEAKKDNYLFLGWYTDASGDPDKRITEIPAGNMGPVSLWAKWFHNTYYVSETGSDDPLEMEVGSHTGGNGSQGAPWATVAKAVAYIYANGNPDYSYVIKIDGKIKENVRITGKDGFGSKTFSLLTIKGVHTDSSDTIDGGGNGPAVYVACWDTQHVQFDHITITGGYSTRGAGIRVYRGNVHLREGTIITGNELDFTYDSPKGAGVYLCGEDEGGTGLGFRPTLSIYDYANISNNEYDADFHGGAVDKGWGKGVYVSKGAAFYMYGGNITYNGYRDMYGRDGGTGGGVYVDTGAFFAMYGGKIDGNRAQYGNGVTVIYSAKKPEFQMKEKAKIGTSNEIYLVGTGFYVSGLENDFVANIRIADAYLEAGRPVLLPISTGGSVSQYVGKFNIVNTGYTLGSDGKLIESN